MASRGEEHLPPNRARALARRVESFLEELERQGHPPDGWESDQLAQLLVHLEANNFAVGGDAMLRLENPLAWRTPRVVLLAAESPRITIAECRASLARIVAHIVGKGLG